MELIFNWIFSIFVTHPTIRLLHLQQGFLVISLALQRIDWSQQTVTEVTDEELGILLLLLLTAIVSC